MVPVATLYHWDLPQALEDVGGWTVRDVTDRFAEYTQIAVDALGDEVGMWITLNEPWCSAWLGYGIGVHAPGRTEPALSVAATHHLLLAHAKAVEVLRRSTKVPVGITLNLGPKIPASDDALDVAAARIEDGALNRLYLDPLFKGQYPADVVQLAADNGAPSTPSRRVTWPPSANRSISWASTTTSPPWSWTKEGCSKRERPGTGYHPVGKAPVTALCRFAVPN